MTQNEFTLPARLYAKLGAWRTGRKDKILKYHEFPETYGAHPKSAWAKWYSLGYHGADLPEEITSKGIHA